MLIEINWGNFKAKFNGREHKQFELLCSLLFYKEHNKLTGALRYLNQTGLEADPVTVGNDVIGWQAKFLDSSSSIGKNKAKLVKAIDDAKSLHPALTRIYFYLNVDFPSNTKKGGKEPKYKTDIESHAKSVGIEIVWKTSSFFETPFVSEENANIASHFFTLGPSVIDFLEELQRHTDAVLAPIRSEIALPGATIKIDRAPIIGRLKDTLASSSLVIVSGDAGVGKTAVIKELYGQISGTAPFFVFKATEFNVTHANQLFKEYGAYTLSDLVREFGDTAEKLIVIDSAEKLAELERPEVFQEVLSTLKGAGWRIVFTTRLSYLEYLKYVFAEIYNVAFDPLNVPNLTAAELAALSVTYEFALPANERFRTLLQNPFYLHEYLRTSPTGEAATTYPAFREAIWNGQVARISFQKDNAPRRREEAFLELARKRAFSGQFFVTVAGFDEALQQLEADEIIKFDSGAGGYFITHDLYEEWALERVIERAFRASKGTAAFYTDIGDSLAIRRAFRGWLGDKLALDDTDAARLIQDTVTNVEVPRHWQDEAIVTALLSPYSATFIASVAKTLLEPPPEIVENNVSRYGIVTSTTTRYDYDKSLLYRVLFLLRIACKEVDQSLLTALATVERDAFTFSSYITQPRGTGWTSVIVFLNTHRTTLGVAYLHLVLPVLEDWNRYNRQGSTTKAAGELALFYFDELTKSERFPFGLRDETRDQLVSTIFNGAAEIKDALSRIFSELVRTKNIDRQTRYYPLASTALGALLKSAVVVQTIPNEVIALARLFWLRPISDDDDWPSHGGMDIEQYFDLADDYHELYPASAYQTPTLRLLQVAPNAAVDLILFLTNRSIQFFAQTKFAEHEVADTTFVLDPAQPPIQQYICHRIWNIYRGTQVAPAVLECMHMALEHWLLNAAKTASPEVLESWCLYLLGNSRSASITAVVASVVLAQPWKLFNVAFVLFGNKDFFSYDTARMTLDLSARSHYAISNDPTGMYTKERLKTCDDEHRRQSLEHLALRYQLFRNDDETEETANARQEAIWKVLDHHYSQLPAAEIETDEDKIWRLCLARMDRRKMTITTERKDEGVVIAFNPDIDAGLRTYSENALTKNAEATKYFPLSLWARYRYERNEDEVKKYPQYDSDPARALAECREVIELLAKNPDADTALFYRAVPPAVCAVMVRDYPAALDGDSKAFCRQVLLSYGSRSFRTNYQYQIGDGVDAAIGAMPALLRAVRESRDDVMQTLLFTLLDMHSAGIGRRFSDYSVSAILDLWAQHKAEAEALLVAFLYLRPKFDALWKKMRQRNFEEHRGSFTRLSLFQQFAEEHAADIAKAISNEISYGDLPPLRETDLDVLVTACLLLPPDTTDKHHTELVRETAIRVAQEMMKPDRGERTFDAAQRHRFLNNFAHFVLERGPDDIATYVQPFVNDLQSLKEAGDVFREFINAQLSLNRYDSFWKVWDLFYPSIANLSKRGGRGRRSSAVIHNYLFAWPYWRKGVKQWDALREREKAFFKRVAEELGDDPNVLFAMAKVLNEVATPFEADGVFWISGILQRNPGIADDDLEPDTVYYLEQFIRGYVLRNRHKVRSTAQIKERVLAILNFLLGKGSVTAYLIREDIL